MDVSLSKTLKTSVFATWPTKLPLRCVLAKYKLLHLLNKHHSLNDLQPKGPNKMFDQAPTEAIEVAATKHLPNSTITHPVATGDHKVSITLISSAMIRKIYI
jgi:hypothetical protein